MCLLKCLSHWSCLEPRIFGGVFGADGGYDTRVEVLLAWERGRLCGNVAIPADSGPCHLLLLRHLLHGSLKRFRKHLPDVFWVQGIPPQWRERMLNGLWIFCLYFPPEASQQAGECGASHRRVVLWCLQLSLAGCGFFPVLYCHVFVGNLFLQTISSSVFQGIAPVYLLPSLPGVFLRNAEVSPGYLVSGRICCQWFLFFQQTASWSWCRRLSRTQTTEK